MPKSVDPMSLLGFGSKQGGAGGMDALQSLLGMLSGGSSGFFGKTGSPMSAYNDLSSQVSQLLGQTGTFRSNEINRQVGDTTNTSLARLQDRGLASSSLSANTALGGERVRQSAQTDLSSQIAGLQANSMQNIGLAGLGAQNQFFSQQSQQLSQLMQALLGSNTQQTMQKNQIQANEAQTNRGQAYNSMTNVELQKLMGTLSQSQSNSGFLAGTPFGSPWGTVNTQVR
jgi:hypothetical protein